MSEQKELKIAVTTFSVYDDPRNGVGFETKVCVGADAARKVCIKFMGAFGVFTDYLSMTIEEIQDQHGNFYAETGDQDGTLQEFFESFDFTVNCRIEVSNGEVFILTYPLGEECR